MNFFRSLPIALFSLTCLHRLASEATPEQENDSAITGTGTDPANSDVSTMRGGGGRGGGGRGRSRGGGRGSSPQPSSRHYVYPIYPYMFYSHRENYGYSTSPPVRVLSWDRDLPFSPDQNVTVVDAHDGAPLYTIIAAPPRGFIITDRHGEVVLQAREKKKAHCGFKYTYHTPMDVSYSIDPRGWFTDRWEIEIYGNGSSKPYHKLKYYRGSTSNTGTIIDVTEGKSHPFQAARIDDFKDSGLAGLAINKPDIGDHYFIGLWIMVHKRMDRCGQ